MLASYLAVPIATVFLVGMLWRKATPAAAFTIMVTGIPLGFVVKWLLAALFNEKTVLAYSLDNFFIISGITQAVCIGLMITISLFTRPRPYESISSLLVSKETLQLPKQEQNRTVFKSFRFWWIIFVIFYLFLYIYLW